MFTKANAEAYFNGGKQESLIFLIIGVAAVLAALVLWFYLKHSWAKGAALPLLLTGLVQLVAGYTVYAQCDAQRKDIVYKMDMDPGALKNRELPRMEKIARGLVAYRYVEMGLLLAGLALFMVYKGHTDRQYWMGLGAGLALQAFLLLLGNIQAERRARGYLEGLKGFVQANF